VSSNNAESTTESRRPAALTGGLVEAAWAGTTVSARYEADGRLMEESAVGRAETVLAVSAVPALVWLLPWLRIAASAKAGETGAEEARRWYNRNGRSPGAHFEPPEGWLGR
jgi:hypothetical protein